MPLRRPSLTHARVRALLACASALGLGACQCGALPRDKGPDPKQNAQVRRPTGGYDTRNIPPASERPAATACTPGQGEDGRPTLAGRPLPWLEPQRDAELVAYPFDAQRVLLAWRPDLTAPEPPRLPGVLWRVSCATPEAHEVFVEREGADFGHGAATVGGRGLFFTDADGVGLLDLATRRVTRVTTAPRAGEGCWAAAAGDEARLRDVVVALAEVAPEPELIVHRGGACGYEGAWVAREVRLRAPGDPARGSEHAPHPVSAVSAGPGRTLWLGDAGRCEEPGVIDPQTVGAVWRSDDGGKAWTRVPVEADGPMQTAAREVAADPERPGHLLVLGAVCRNGGRGVYGGELFATRDGGASWTRLPLPPGTDGRHAAERLVDVHLVGGRIDHFVARTGVGERWETRDLGQRWEALGSGPALDEDGRLVTVGADQYRATPDGLWWHEAAEARRVFPPEGAPQ